MPVSPRAAYGSVFVMAAVAAATLSADVQPAAGNCNAPAPDAVTHVTMPGNPFQALPSRDGCWIYVSLPATATSPGRVALFRRAGGNVTLVREVGGGSPGGMILTTDQSLLVVAAGPTLAFIDTARFASGHAQPVLGTWQDDRPAAGLIYANITQDDHYLFVSEERAQSIAVFDLAAMRKDAFANLKPLGRIPVGRSPIALTFSPDGRYLYTTSQSMPDLGWPIECKPEGAPDPAAAAPNHPMGAILVVDVARAIADPAKVVVSTVKAGCNPVRLAISPKGDVAYVTARNSHALLAFDARKLVDDPSAALIGRVPTGTAPVGVAVLENGRTIVVTNSNRFAGSDDDRQSLTVVDAARIGEGAAAVVGSIPAGGFPRELRLTDDGRTLLVTNFRSKTLQIVDVARLPR